MENLGKIGREITRANELGFREIAAILSPLVYMEAAERRNYP
jgi:hypothetical protein